MTLNLTLPRERQPEPDGRIGDDDFDRGADEVMCDCGKTLWNDCDCGAFFEEWICGMGHDGQCSMAGSEDCDFECPVMADLRRRRK